MPIEIRELLIRAFVSDDKEYDGAKGGNTSVEDLDACKNKISENAVEESMGQIMEMIKNQNER